MGTDNNRRLLLSLVVGTGDGEEDPAKGLFCRMMIMHTHTTLVTVAALVVGCLAFFGERQRDVGGARSVYRNIDKPGNPHNLLHDIQRSPGMEIPDLSNCRQKRILHHHYYHHHNHDQIRSTCANSQSHFYHTPVFPFGFCFFIYIAFIMERGSWEQLVIGNY